MIKKYTPRVIIETGTLMGQAAAEKWIAEATEYLKEKYPYLPIDDEIIYTP